MEASSVTELYEAARRYVVAKGFKWEIDLVEYRIFSELVVEEFFQSYVFVVLSTGLRNQVAQKIYDKFIESGGNPSATVRGGKFVIAHGEKRAALMEAKEHYAVWFDELKRSQDKLSYLQNLPFIGKVTKFHLARNIGLDVVKPDRHLVRLAKFYGFKTAEEMCQHIAARTGHRIGTVDVILWRASNLGFIKTRMLEGGN